MTPNVDTLPLKFQCEKYLANPTKGLEDTQIAWKTDEDNTVGSPNGYLVTKINNYSEDL